VERSEIFRKRRGNTYRQLALYLAKKHTRMSLREIGKLFDMDYSAVSQAVKRFEHGMNRNKSVMTMKDLLEKRLKKD